MQIRSRMGSGSSQSMTQRSSFIYYELKILASCLEMACYPCCAFIPPRDKRAVAAPSVVGEVWPFILSRDCQSHQWAVLIVYKLRLHERINVFPLAGRTLFEAPGVSRGRTFSKRKNPPPIRQNMPHQKLTFCLHIKKKNCNCLLSQAQVFTQGQRPISHTYVRVDLCTVSRAEKYAYP